MAQALDAVAALNARGGFIAGVNPDMIRLPTRAGTNSIVMSTAGIRPCRTCSRRCASRSCAAQEASEQELPYVAPEDPDGTLAGPRGGRLHDGRAGLPDDRPAICRSAAASLPELLGQMLQTTPRRPAGAIADVPAASDAILRALAADPRRDSRRADLATRSGDALAAPAATCGEAVDIVGICTILEAPLGLHVRDAFMSQLPFDVPTDLPLQGETLVFTGRLWSISRKDARAAVGRLGGACDDEVTPRTTLLVVGAEPIRRACPTNRPWPVTRPPTPRRFAARRS